jgi:hypothetical protein
VTAVPTTTSGNKRQWGTAAHTTTTTTTTDTTQQQKKCNIFYFKNYHEIKHSTSTQCHLKASPVSMFSMLSIFSQHWLNMMNMLEFLGHDLISVVARMHVESLVAVPNDACRL